MGDKLELSATNLNVAVNGSSTGDVVDFAKTWKDKNGFTIPNKRVG